MKPALISHNLESITILWFVYTFVSKYHLIMNIEQKKLTKEDQLSSSVPVIGEGDTNEKEQQIDVDRSKGDDDV